MLLNLQHLEFAAFGTLGILATVSMKTTIKVTTNLLLWRWLLNIILPSVA